MQSSYLLIIPYYVSFNVFPKKQKYATAKCSYMDLYALLYICKIAEAQRDTRYCREKKSFRHRVLEIYFCLFISTQHHLYVLGLLKLPLISSGAYSSPNFTNMDPLGTATFFCDHTSLARVDRSKMDPNWANHSTVAA